MIFEDEENGGLSFQSSNDEQPIVERFSFAIKEYGFDSRVITFGVNPSPDFGYFDLASRYWRASLCIYFSGGIGCFVECGVGFTEPWLFNIRHSVELYLKGFILYTGWFNKVNKNLVESGYIEIIENLKKCIGNPHSLFDLYQQYKNEIKSVICEWNTDFLGEKPPSDSYLLNDYHEKILTELNELDEKSFTFRYPSLRENGKDIIQELKWVYDTSKLYEITGLPKKAGIPFNHVRAVHSLQELRRGLVKISHFHNAIWGYVDE